jgi:hypothetical protein
VDPRILEVKLPSNIEKAVEAKGSDLLVNLNKTSDILMAVSSSRLPRRTLNFVFEEQRETLNLSRSFYEDALVEIKRVRDNAADSFNLGSSVYNSQFDRIISTSVDPEKEVTDQEFLLLDGFEKAITGLNFILSSTALFKSPYEARIQNVKSQFDSTELNNVRAEDAVKEVILPKDVDLERLALRELGDHTRWVELVELNNLKPPYISQDQSSLEDGILVPGDKILIPQPLISGFGTTPFVKERFINQDLNTIQRNLGIDFRLDNEFDLVISNRGDLELVRAEENAAQAVIIKIALEKGDLLEHPTLGLGLTPGSKGNPINVVKVQLLHTLTSDPRFESVENLEIVREDGTLRLKFSLKIKDVDQPVPIDLKL